MDWALKVEEENKATVKNLKSNMQKQVMKGMLREI
jgi:hypothetical protein